MGFMRMSSTLAIRWRYKRRRVDQWRWSADYKDLSTISAEAAFVLTD
jgi:hypothetical protein